MSKYLQVDDLLVIISGSQRGGKGCLGDSWIDWSGVEGGHASRNTMGRQIDQPGKE